MGKRQMAKPEGQRDFRWYAFAHHTFCFLFIVFFFFSFALFHNLLSLAPSTEFTPFTLSLFFFIFLCIQRMIVKVLEVVSIYRDAFRLIVQR